MTLPLETSIIYGPLFSRRLGLSLGINVLPATYKVCTFDCIYCHYGLTNKDNAMRMEALPTAGQIYGAVEQALRGSLRFDTITFSGNGEPTLHPQFVDIVARVRELRDRFRPDVELSLYSNASTVVQPRIREALQYFDNPIMKLDTGDQEIFKQVNRPIGNIDLADIVAGLKQVPHLIIQSLLVNGLVSNCHAEAIQSWQAVIADIKPEKIQLYSCDYPVPLDSVNRVLPYILKRIASETEKVTGVEVTPYWIH